jgi:hypothetical protein
VSYQRSEWRKEVANQGDFLNSASWDFTPGAEVDRRIGTALDRLWRRILDANRFYRLALRTPVSDASGRYVVADLSNVAVPDAQERLYRVLNFSIDNYPYEDKCDDAEDLFLMWTAASSNTGGVTTGRRVFWRGGNFIYTLPIQTLKPATVCTVNHIPTAFDKLSADSVTVEFPEGFEDVGFNEAAADLLMKGAKETDASAELRVNGKQRMDEMLEYVARFTTKASQVRYGDDGSAWGTTY